MEMTKRVNHLPVLTWNKLKLNDAELLINTEFGKVNTFADAALPAGVTAEKNVSFDELVRHFDALAVSSPKEKIVAGKLPIYNEQRFATGMGKEIDDLIVEADCKTDIYTVDGTHTDPIVLRYDYKNGASGLSSTLIHAKAGSESTWVMYYTSEGKQTDNGLVGASTRVFLEEGAKVHLVKVQMLSEGYTFFDDIGVISGKASELSLAKLSLGAKRAYEGFNDYQIGDKSRLTVDYGTICRDGSFTDINYNDIFIGKKAEGVMRFFEPLYGNAEKTFRGTLDFRQNSKASVGDEQEDVLLFGEDVINKTIPLILCEEEDVEGRHAATIGRLSDEMLFYMQTRGLSEHEAKKLMVRANLNKVARLVPDEGIRHKIDEYIKDVI